MSAELIALVESLHFWVTYRFPVEFGKTIHKVLALTGEITLRGQVLPVGGIKEKVLAAHRAGIKEIILPDWNQKDLEDVPDRRPGRRGHHPDTPGQARQPAFARRIEESLIGQSRLARIDQGIFELIAQSLAVQRQTWLFKRSHQL